VSCSYALLSFDSEERNRVLLSVDRVKGEIMFYERGVDVGKCAEISSQLTPDL
jgi:hypothetical protein